MRDALQYPFDHKALSRHRRTLKAQLAAGGPFLETKIAVLGGSTTAELVAALELFLLADGIKPAIYESAYNRFYEDVMVDVAALRAFAPDFVWIHTTHHNVRAWPPLLAGDADVDALLAAERGRFESLWQRLLELGDATIIQNNFDPPPLEPLGHLAASARFARAGFVDELNRAFAAFARAEPRLRINDSARLAALLGLARWAAPRDWLAYKMAVTPEAAVELAHQAAKIVRAALGRTKKCLVVDLDNTLWGGVIGDDGVAGLRLGNETPEGEAYLAFQRYARELRERGVLLAVCSKNEPAAAREGFAHPDSVLQLDDFSSFQASWREKPEGLRAIAAELHIGLDSLVFVDDSPFERELVKRQLPEVAVAKVGDVTTFAEVIDREGWFEPFSLTREDAPRAALYAADARRAALATEYESYDDYLASLDMRAEIAPFSAVYLERIAQLTNKTNQFNLTTRRYTLAQIGAIAGNPEYLTLYGRLADKLGDNGLVSVIIGRARAAELHIELWLMSCRVFKRTLEHAMFDALCDAARARGSSTLVGRYARTAKNAMVADLYPSLGFTLAERGDDGESALWTLPLATVTAPTCRHIRRS